jgi:hypothetical protein
MPSICIAATVMAVSIGGIVIVLLLLATHDLRRQR